MQSSSELTYLLSLVKDDPTNWVLRKEAALKLYEAGEFLQAADMVWQTPEIPSTDMDVGFAVKVLSRSKPNRSIRMIYELMSRNAGKAPQSIALANVFNMIGYPMLAARCYGAALSLNAEYVDMGFEEEAFVEDLRKEVTSAWGRHTGDMKSAFAQLDGDLEGDPICFAELNHDLDQESFKNASEEAVKGDASRLGQAFAKFATIANAEEKSNKLLFPGAKD